MELYFKKYGEQGQPFLILHGVFGMLDNWHSLSKKLSEHYTVYAIDLRNHGHSPHDSEMNYEVMADDVHQLIEKEQLEDVILLGHSMGGKVAMKFASLFPDKLAALIVADIAPKRYRAGHTRIIAALNHIDFGAMRSRTEANKILTEWLHDEGVVFFLLKNLTRKEEGGYRLKMNLKAIEENYTAIIGEIEFGWPLNIPTLFLKGGDSHYVSEEDEHDIEQWFQQVYFDVVPNAGHWLHADQPKVFLDKVHTFLNSI